MKIYNFIRILIVSILILVSAIDIYSSYVDVGIYKKVYEGDKLNYIGVNHIRICDVISIFIGIIYIVGFMLLLNKMKHSKILSIIYILLDIIIVIYLFYIYFYSHSL